eukprot:scaffold97995_cov67-Phaeocystis_antarctica.AAC.1
MARWWRRWWLVSQSLPHTSSTELTAYTHTLLWSSFKCAAGISASSNADASSSFFWKVIVLQDGLLLLSLFTYLLVAGADFVESGGYSTAWDLVGSAIS